MVVVDIRLVERKERLQAELRLLLTKAKAAPVTDLDFPHLLSALALHAEKAGPGDVLVVDLQPLLDRRIEQVADELTRERLGYLLGSSPDRFRALQERGTNAAHVDATTYNAYRRTGGGRMHTDLLLLAREVERGLSGDTEKSNRSRSPLLPIVALALLSLVILVWWLSGRADDIQSATDSPSAAAAEPASISLTPTTDQASLTTSSPDEGPFIDDWIQECAAIGATLSLIEEDEIEAARTIARSAEVPPRSCAGSDVERRGRAYLQELKVDELLAGGVILDSRVGSPVVLGLGPWQSYIRIGGGDGSRSTTLGGAPTGEFTKLVENGLWEMEVTGDVLLTSEDRNGTYYWMPNIATDRWRADQAGENMLGNPTSSLWITDGAFRVDFERGYLIQRTDGTVETQQLSEEQLQPPERVEGRLISSIDGTGWFVDDELRRWWIPDLDRFDCAGGTRNQVANDLLGGQIHSLSYGGVFVCPTVRDVTTFVEGALSLDLYCRLVLSAGSVILDGRQYCATDTISTEVEPSDVCRWQYGDHAVATKDDSGSYCKNGASSG